MELVYHIIEFIKKWSSYLSIRNDKQNIEDTFYQLLRDKDYDEAERLAQQHKYLDIDIVYQCKWRSSGITVQSINTVLGKIGDKLWAINDCVDTVPISYEACRTLIEFGLRETNLRLLYQLGNEDPLNLSSSDSKHCGKLGFKRDKKHDRQPLLADDASDEEIEGLIDFNNLNDRQKELCRCRQDLLHHEHSLFAYESILGDYRTIQQHFDHVFYEEFRRKCPLQACIDYAHDGDAHAVEILLNFYTDSLAPHLLAILSNLPETLSPYQYRNLLPCLRQEDVVYEWRALSGKIKKEEFDWSYQGVANSPFAINLKCNSEEYEKEFYEENLHLKKFLQPLTSEILTQWFIERALELESWTLLSSNAIQLLILGSELNIKNLKNTERDLFEFQGIIYDCCTDNDIYLSYTEFSQKSELERLILMTGDSVKNCRDRFRNFVIPYMHRRDAKWRLEKKASLLQDYFRTLANTREQVCRTIYSDLLDKIECDNFVAEWTSGLDDVIDSIGEEMKIIERNRQAKQLSTMAEQTFKLGDYNECYEACQLIMKKEHKECWAHCCNLGMSKQFNNLDGKYKLLAFALAHCDDTDGKTSTKILDYIIELRKRDERIQFAYLQSNM